MRVRFCIRGWVFGVNKEEEDISFCFCGVCILGVIVVFFIVLLGRLWEIRCSVYSGFLRNGMVVVFFFCCVWVYFGFEVEENFKMGLGGFVFGGEGCS